ncbi:MAG: hypothetical protein A4E49_02571 [Methanosaeta sp. PtaU1.Bin112]|nr:MAG: hypothetical protein A4E49_02571 [Methanosaeta sp. PtaU1.Bin112]
MAHVGDINIACRTMGQRDPIALIMDCSSTMDMRDPRLPDGLAAKYRVIIFDSRGTGNTAVPPESSLILAQRINASWQVQFNGAGHG